MGMSVQSASNSQAEARAPSADQTEPNLANEAVTEHPPVATARDYFQLLKPRVMTLVVFTGIAGMLVAPGSLHPVLAAVGILCIAVSAGAAGAINMWYDRDIDAVMKRTVKRPIPSGRIVADEALGLGIFLSIASVAVMGLATNWLAAALLAGANLFYVLIYTMWLKRRTPQNIVIGGAAGAFPPMIGWAAVTGDVTWTPVAMFLIIFLWTPPHFWALALFHEGDYGAAKVPMLPNVAGARATKWQMLFYTLILLPVSLVPMIMGASSWYYGMTAGFLSLIFIAMAVLVLQAPDDDHSASKIMFRFSLLYLTGIFAALMVDKLLATLFLPEM
jgi:protoheme IX farnesyltransferase